MVILRHHRKRKGVSPLIAAVLLIAFTMAIAAILTAWITNFTTTQKEHAEKFEVKIQCAYADISADTDFAKWNSTEKVFYDYIRNTGSEDVEIVEVEIWADGEHFIPRKINTTQIPRISVGEGKELYIDFSEILTSDSPSLERIIFRTRCESVWAPLTRPTGGWTPLTCSGTNCDEAIGVE